MTKEESKVVIDGLIAMNDLKNIEIERLKFQLKQSEQETKDCQDYWNP